MYVYVCVCVCVRACVRSCVCTCMYPATRQTHTQNDKQTEAHTHPHIHDFLTTTRTHPGVYMTHRSGAASQKRSFTREAAPVAWAAARTSSVRTAPHGARPRACSEPASLVIGDRYTARNTPMAVT